MNVWPCLSYLMQAGGRDVGNVIFLLCRKEKDKFSFSGACQ